MIRAIASGLVVALIAAVLLSGCGGSEADGGSTAKAEPGAGE